MYARAPLAHRTRLENSPISWHNTQMRERTPENRRCILAIWPSPSFLSARKYTDELRRIASRYSGIKLLSVKHSISHRQDYVQMQQIIYVSQTDSRTRASSQQLSICYSEDKIFARILCRESKSSINHEEMSLSGQTRVSNTDNLTPVRTFDVLSFLRVIKTR